MAFLFRRAQQSAPPPETATSDDLIQPILTEYTAGKKDTNNAIPGSDQVAQKGTLVTVARSIRHCVAGMSPWDISDLTLGLYKIAARHALEGMSDSIEGSVVSNKQELEEILHWLDWAWASYLADVKAITEFLHIEGQQLKKHVNTSAILKPAYCIAVDDKRKCVVLSIRGTYAATDVLTDLQPHNEKFEEGYAHSGILSAARWILGNENDTLQILLSENQGYKLVLTGHSLGAGAACLLSYLLRESVGCENEDVSLRLGIPSSMIECWGFGCPPCVDKQHSESAPFIKNIVLQDDIVARASVAALEDLRSEILQTNWEDVLEDGGIAKRMLGLVNNTNTALGNVEQVLGYPQGTFVQQAKSLSYAALIGSFRASLARSRGGPIYHGPPEHYQSMYQYGPPRSCYYPPTPHAHPVPYGQFYPPENPLGNPHAAPTFPPNGGGGPTPQGLVRLISYGASALGFGLNDPGNASNDSMGANGKSMEGGRLFVPGILYHIKRMTPGAGVTTEPDVARAGVEKVLDEEKSSLTVTTATMTAPARHMLIKGLSPKERFMKIVLSKSLLSDHSLVSYKDAMKNAIKDALGE